MDESSAANEMHAEVAGALTRTLIAERYRVLRVLGQGSSGIVYLCEHTALEKEVAVKVLHRELADNAGLVARFTREAQTAARLDHPSSVHVMDFGQDRDGTLYLAMEYVDGPDLAQLLQEKLPLDDERIVHFMTCILSALSAAHALGIVHRDLKPENVLVRVADPASGEADIVKVCDFGVAQFSPVRLTRQSSAGPISTQTRRVTGEGMMVGTPWYMSPEQARAEALDARSDIYSAGVVLFQLLTRTLPFVGDDVMAVALMHCTTLPPPPSGYCAVHPGLEAVCLRALSKTPEARFQSASEMLSALRTAVATKVATRSLARASRPTGIALALAPVSFRPGRTDSTPLTTQAVRLPQTLRKVKPSFLVAGVATTLLGVAALPQLLPSQHTVTTVSADAKLEPVIGVRTAMQPLAASVVIQDDPDLSLPAQMSRGFDLLPSAAELELAMSSSELAKVEEPSVAPAPPAEPKVIPLLPKPAAQPRKLEAPAVGGAKPSAVVPVAAVSPQRESADVQAAAPSTPAPTPAAVTVALSDDSVPETPGEAAASAAAIALATLPQAAPAPAVAPKPAVPPKLPTPAKLTRVDVSAERLPPGTSRASLRGALNQVALLGCYAQAQQRSPQLELPGTALDLKTNTSGHIVWAHITNGALPQPLRECLEQVARSGNVRKGEGGETQATLNLVPLP